MDNVRILKGYSKAEQKELEEAKDNGFGSAFDVIYGIIKSEGDLDFIVKKYDEGSSSDNDQLAKDIVDYYAGVAKFAEQKYYIHLIKDDKYSYLKTDVRGEVYLDSNFEYGIWKTKFTYEEIISMNPKLLLFEEEVEDDE